MPTLLPKYKRQSGYNKPVTDLFQVIATDLSPIQPTWYVNSVTDKRVHESHPKLHNLILELRTLRSTYMIRVPPNLNFEIDDAEDEWLYKTDSLDFVHCRYLFHGIRNWPKLFDQAMRYLFSTHRLFLLLC